MNIMFAWLGNRQHSGSFEGMRCCGAPSKVYPPQNLGEDASDKLEDIEGLSVGMVEQAQQAQQAQRGSLFEALPW